MLDKLSLNKALVKMANNMARTRWSIKDATSVKILLCLIACIEEDDQHSEEYSFPVDLIIPYIGEGTHTRINDACERLSKSTLIWLNPETNLIHHTPIFQDIIEPRNNGFIRAVFNFKILPYLFELKEQYTSFSLKEALRLSSAYSRNLFLVLSSYNKTNTSIILGLNDYLYERLEVPKSMRNSYQNFRRRILEPAGQEINEKTSLKYTWEPVRTSHKITHINFLFSSPTDENIINQQNNDEFAKKQRIKFLISQGFNFENAQYLEDLIIKADKDFDTFLSRVLHYYSKLPHDRQVSKQGYIRAAIEKECQLTLPFGDNPVVADFEDVKTMQSKLPLQEPKLTQPELAPVSKEEFDLHLDALECFYYEECKENGSDKCNYCRENIKTKKIFYSMRPKKRRERGLPIDVI